VTPTSVNTSRIALLLTSSSLARSLIRILLIRLFVPPDCAAKPSYQPHETAERRAFAKTLQATSLQYFLFFLFCRLGRSLALYSLLGFWLGPLGVLSGNFGAEFFQSIVA